MSEVTTQGDGMRDGWYWVNNTGGVGMKIEDDGSVDLTFKVTVPPVTLCEACRAPVAARHWLNRPQDVALFVEVYSCGSVRAWGLVLGDGIIRECQGVCDD